MNLGMSELSISDLKASSLELGNDFYSFDRIDKTSLSKEIEQIVTRLPFSSTLDVVKMLTIPSSTD